jgi:membrane protease YdiL (CAAX protease family)
MTAGRKVIRPTVGILGMSQSDPWGPRTERGPHRGYALLGGVVAAVLGIAAAFVLSGAVVVGVGGLGGQIGLIPTVMLLFVTSAIGLAGSGALYLYLRGISPVSYVGVQAPGLGDLLWAVGGYVGALAIVFGAGLVLTALNAEPETTNQAAELGMENPELLLWLVPLSFLVIAPAEEFLFRGVIQGRLREAFLAKLAIPLTAGLFALVHYFSLTGGAGARLTAISILFFPSLVFGYAYERTENLVVPIVIHGAYNSTLVLLVYVTIKLLGEAPA